MVLYVDDESLTLMTPQGRPESGWVTFRAFGDEADEAAIVARVQRSARPGAASAAARLGRRDSSWRTGPRSARPKGMYPAADNSGYEAAALSSGQPRGFCGRGWPLLMTSDNGKGGHRARITSEGLS